MDKITILEIKTECIADEAKLRNIRAELAVLTAVRAQWVQESAALTTLTAELKVVNEKLWAIEDEIRDCERGGFRPALRRTGALRLPPE